MASIAIYDDDGSSAAPSVAELVRRANTQAQIDALCGNPLPSIAEFVAFYAASGLSASKTMFYSGLRSADVWSAAESQGRTTLQMLLAPNKMVGGPRILPGCEKYAYLADGKDNQQWWDNASAALAEWAKGDIAVMLHPDRWSEVRAGTSTKVWSRVEYPILRGKLQNSANKLRLFLATDASNAHDMGDYHTNLAAP